MNFDSVLIELNWGGVPYCLFVCKTIYCTTISRCFWFRSPHAMQSVDWETVNVER